MGRTGRNVWDSDCKQLGAIRKPGRRGSRATAIVFIADPIPVTVAVVTALVVDGVRVLVVAGGASGHGLDHAVPCPLVAGAARDALALDFPAFRVGAAWGGLRIGGRGRRPKGKAGIKAGTLTPPPLRLHLSPHPIVACGGPGGSNIIHRAARASLGEDYHSPTVVR